MNLFPGDDDPFRGPMAHDQLRARGRTNETYEARLKRLGRDLEKELQEEKVTFQFEGSVVRVPNPDDGALFGGMIRIRAYRGGLLIKSQLSPLETRDHGLYLSTEEADVQRLLDRQIANLKETLT